MRREANVSDRAGMEEATGAVPLQFAPRTADSGPHSVPHCDSRRCERCGNMVSNPLATRCPRCWAPLPGMRCGGCTGCSLGR